MEAVNLKNSIIYYYGSPSGYLKDGRATIDTLFECEELKDWCKHRQYTPTFTDGIFERLMNNAQISQFSESEYNPRNVRIWQLRADSDFSMRFIPFEEFSEKFGQPEKGSYQVVYDGNLNTENLDIIFEICNLAHPKDYNGHSLSISDVVELYDESGSEFHYVDRFGFAQIDFEAREQTQGFEMKMEL